MLHKQGLTMFDIDNQTKIKLSLYSLMIVPASELLQPELAPALGNKWITFRNFSIDIFKFQELS